jgi:hypothetical protein
MGSQRGRQVKRTAQERHIIHVGVTDGICEVPYILLPGLWRWAALRQQKSIPHPELPDPSLLCLAKKLLEFLLVHRIAIAKRQRGPAVIGDLEPKASPRLLKLSPQFTSQVVQSTLKGFGTLKINVA